MASLQKQLFFILLFMLLFISCSTWSKTEFEKLPDKNFNFQKFSYTQKGINGKKAFVEMKNFPTDKLLKVISHKYNISIDTSEYEDFLKFEDLSDLTITGFLNQEYKWENKNKNKNIIEIEYRIDEKVQQQYFQRRYYIFIKIDGKSRTEFSGELSDKEPYLLTIAKDMDYSRVDKNSDNSYINDETKSVVDVSTGIFKNLPRESKADLTVKIGKDYPDRMKNDIREYIKILSPADRKKFRDDTIKYLYKVIE
jgi:hypothetical protein